MLTIHILVTYLLIDFIYRKIILPSIRQQYRDRLFQIRDKIRIRIIEGNLNKTDLNAANLMNSRLNSFINRLHILNMSNQIRTQVFMKNNPEIAKKIDIEVKKEFDLLINCSTIEIKESFIDMMDILQKVSLYNNLITFLTWLPIVLLYLLYRLLANSIKDLIYEIRISNANIEKLDEKYVNLT
ncbi:hypothetical protein [Rodentibacter caecimuris]|uniref:hypothetical protein n=1 Tax=Rodentibacter caecimuris TaxID=1796644 RepID=UPI000750B660|nr:MULTISPECIES: hypothetical protein [Pasteurellaceae]AOF52570.1 hypothetical protein AC062_0474 [Pasteurellaceae bacterium NI1060]QIA76740.1 hypothetical protein FEE42_04900 [Rodentibacter heylii]TGY48976.1 hypothetical protein E5343_08395 [Pasteurella caecimuris]